MVYFSTKVESPSKKILRFVRDKGPLPYQDVLREFADEELILSRLSDLERYGYIRFSGKEYSLEPRGVMIARLLEIYQTLSGRKMGG